MNSVCQFFRVTRKKKIGVYIFQCPVLSHQLLEWNPNGVTFFFFSGCSFRILRFCKCHVQYVIFFFPEASLQMKRLYVCCLCNVYTTLLFSNLKICIRFFHLFTFLRWSFWCAFFHFSQCTHIELVYIIHSVNF